MQMQCDSSCTYLGFWEQQLPGGTTTWVVDCNSRQEAAVGVISTMLWFLNAPQELQHLVLPYMSESIAWHGPFVAAGSHQELCELAHLVKVVLQPEFVPRLASVHQPACPAGSSDLTIIELDVVMKIRGQHGVSRLTRSGCWTKPGFTPLLLLLAWHILAVIWSVANYTCRAVISAASACSFAPGSMRSSSSSGTTDLHRSSQCWASASGSKQQPLPRLHLRFTFGVQDRAGTKLTGQVEFVRVRAINLPSLPLISWLCGLLVMLATCFWSDFQAADLDSETITLQQEHLYNIHYSGLPAELRPPKPWSVLGSSTPATQADGAAAAALRVQAAADLRSAVRAAVEVLPQDEKGVLSTAAAVLVEALELHERAEAARPLGDPALVDPYTAAEARDAAIAAHNKAQAAKKAVEKALNTVNAGRKQEKPGVA